jgi:large subunit ribosomal protein L15
MKLHDLRPAEGSRKERTRVGRGIAAGKGKTAGRGTKGQKARAGGSIPPWFEGGQTPLHVRIPKLRGFKNRFKIEYEVVNVGAIAAAVERGALETADRAPSGGKSKSAGQITVNQDLLRAVGLVRTLNKPLKILGAGELSSPLFVVADAFTASARTKIEAAGGTVSVLEVPTRPTKAIGVETETAAPREARSKKAATTDADTDSEPAVETDLPVETEATAEIVAAVETEPAVQTEATAESPPAVETEATVETDAAADEAAPAKRRRGKAKTEAAEAVASDTPSDREAEADTTPDDATPASGDDA